MSEEGLRSPDLPSRDEIAERPIRDIQEIRAERNDIENDLVELVAFDPFLVEQMNLILDRLALNRVDDARQARHRFQSSRDRFQEKTRQAEYARARVDVRADWVTRLPQDQAVRQAVNDIRAMILADADRPNAPSRKTVDQAFTNLTAAYARWLHWKIERHETIKGFRKRVIETLWALAQEEKPAAAKALNRAAGHVGAMEIEPGIEPEIEDVQGAPAEG